MESPDIGTTTPNNPQYLWMGGPKQRGTFGIISFCLSTLIICIWSTLHFNIPTRRHTPTRRFSLQVFWMFIALLAPELLLFLAINERINAHTMLKKVLKFHPYLEKPGMLASVNDRISGQAKLRRVSTQCQPPAIHQLIVAEQQHYGPIEQTPQPHFGLVHAFYGIMGGFAFYGPYGHNNPNAEDSLFQISTNPNITVEVPRFETLIYIMEHFPHILTDITEEYIRDQAASSGLSKAILIVQVAWFCMNCVSRLFQGLPLSLLEVSTAAHAFCTLLTYFVWWSKPMNVAAPTLMREKGAQELYALLKCTDLEYDEAWGVAMGRAAEGATGPHASAKIVLAANALRRTPTPGRPPSQDRFKEPDSSLVPGNFGNRSSNEEFSVGISMAISPIFYGLVHFLAWGDNFPTPLERLLWRVSSFMVTFSGLVAVSGAVALTQFTALDESRSNLILGTVVVFGIPAAYMLASGFLIVESFRQLLFLDPAAYQLPSWSNYWPHLS